MRYFIGVFLIFFAVSHALAGPPESDSVGPSLGLELGGELANLRFFGDYGPKKDGFGCFEHAPKINEYLSKNKDCPHNHAAEFIQRLFPSQFFGLLAHNTLERDVVNHLDHEAYGAMIGFSLRHKQDIHKIDENTLVKELSEEIYKIIRPRVVFDREFKEAKSGRNEAKRACSRPNPTDEMRKKLSDSEEILKAFYEKDKTVKKKEPKRDPSGRKYDQADASLEEILPFARLYVRALKFASEHEEKYPKGSIEKAIISFVIANNNHPPSNAEDPHPSSVALIEMMSRFDYFELNSLNPKGFNTFSDEFGFRIIPFGKAFNKDLPEGYSDCSESTVRNIVNLFLFNPKNRKFDFGILNKIEGRDFNGRKVETNKALKEFYTNFSDEIERNDQNARNAWAKIVSGIKNVKYLQPKGAEKYDIEPTPENIGLVLESLFFKGDEGSGLKKHSLVEVLKGIFGEYVVIHKSEEKVREGERQFDIEIEFIEPQSVEAVRDITDRPFRKRMTIKTVRGHAYVVSPD